MTTSDTAARPVATSIVLAIVIGGFASGALDIAFASILSGARPDRVLKYIAAGWVGLKAAHAGGEELAALGAFFHFFVAWCAAAAYTFASQALPMLRRYAIPFGLAFGAALFFFMNWIVVPLSALHLAPHFTVATFLINLIGQMVLFGLPISLAAKYYLGSD